MSLWVLLSFSRVDLIFGVFFVALIAVAIVNVIVGGVEVIAAVATVVAVIVVLTLAAVVAVIVVLTLVVVVLFIAISLLSCFLVSLSY